MELGDKKVLEKRCADLMGRMENYFKCGTPNVLMARKLRESYPDITEGDWIQTIALIASCLCGVTEVNPCKFMDYLCYIDEKVRRELEIGDKEHVVENIELRMDVTDRVNNPDASKEELAALLRASTIMRSKATIGVGVMILCKTENGPKMFAEVWNTPKREISEKDELMMAAMLNQMRKDEDYRAATEKFEKEFLGVNKDEY